LLRLKARNRLDLKPRFSFELGQSAAEKCDNGIMIKKQNMAAAHQK
jgi:hypothetical protein